MLDGLVRLGHRLTRPVAGTNGVGISLVGHHEILIPLIAAAVIEADQSREI